MSVYADPFLTIYFGDAQSRVAREVLINGHVGDDYLFNEALAEIQKTVGFSELYWLTQEHGNNGWTIGATTAQELKGKQLPGDFLITSATRKGLLVYTADCLPIVLYDQKQHAVGICHAGWRGSVAHVAARMLHAMIQTYGTDPQNVRVFFAPSAGSCCYRVSSEFKEQFDKDFCKEPFFVERKNELFFDLVAFNRVQLESLGIPTEAFCYDYSTCTIENRSFCSLRRSSSTDGNFRQITIVSLHS